MGVVSADTLLISHSREQADGTLPGSPVFNPWRLTGESLTFEPNAITSAELGVTGRFTRPSNVVGTTVSGDINIELAKFDALDEAIAGILANEWGEGPLTPGSPGGSIDNANRNTVGDGLQTFTIEKRWPNLNNTPGAVPITATPDAAPGASLDITFGAGTAVGTGIVVVDFQTDLDPNSVRVTIPVAVADDQDDVATAVAAVLNAETNITASAVTNVVTITASPATSIDALDARIGSDQHVFQRYSGCTYSAMTLTTSPNQVVTGSVSVVAGEPELDYLPLAGVTYTDPGNSSVFTAPEVLEFTVGTLPGVQTSCWASITVELDSQNREIACIGSQGSRESALGTFTASVSGELYFVGDQSVLESLLANEIIGDSVLVFTNAEDEIYRFDFYDTRVTSGSLVAGGQNEDVTIPITLEPSPVIVQTDGGENWTSGLIVSDINLVPPAP